MSFDDCFRSWWQALPLFDELELRVTFYLNTEPLRDLSDATTIRNYLKRTEQDENLETLSSDELRQLAAAGHVIGAHGHTHRDLAALPAEAAREEILLSRNRLQEIIEAPVVHFSYPYGMRRNFTEELREFCLASGFITVANAIPGLLHGEQERSAIQRTGWSLGEPVLHNIENLRIDGRWFEKITGRTAAPF
jgi:peptidoglycan/xylan/chitin deacetylase (PgdA/CDA1 family)